MLKIGDFSKLSRATVPTLRHYDELGLLRPERVDAFTGYRYYAFGQLARLNRILALKDLGFSLEQIARTLEQGVTAEQVRGMLRLRRAEQQARVQEEQERLARVEARLNQIEMEGAMSKYDVVIKTVAPLRVAAIRRIIPAYPAQGPLWGELYAFLGAQRAQFAGPCLTLYHDSEYKERDVDAEVCQPIASPVPESGAVKVYDLPGGQMACTVHHGPYRTLSQAYTELMPWIAANGYRIAGPDREIYLQTSGDGNQDDANCVTEIQVPVEKA